MVINPEIKRDERGELWEILHAKDCNNSIKGQIYAFSINPGAVRGNHFHKRKKEWFSVISGECLLILKENGNEEEINLSENLHQVVEVKPNAIHTFKNESKKPAIIIAYIDEEFNSEDSDTFYS